MPTSAPVPFTRREALARGTTVRQLAGTGFQRLFHNLYLPGAITVGQLDRARAVLRVAPDGSFVSHHTAIAIWGGWPPPDTAIHLSTPGESRSRRRGVCSHRVAAGSIGVRHRGLLISPPDQAFLELAAAGATLVELVIAGDSLVHAERTTPERLVDAAGRARRPGIRTARRAAALVRTGVDSAPESRLRLLMVLAGLPEPTVNHIIRGSAGEWVHRFDLSYPALKLVIEYDGRHHADDPRQWSRDLRRREELERDGWRFIVITADDIFNHPEETLVRLWTALVDRGMDGLPVRRATAWAHHFLSR